MPDKETTPNQPEKSRTINWARVIRTILISAGLFIFVAVVLIFLFINAALDSFKAEREAEEKRKGPSPQIVWRFQAENGEITRTGPYVNNGVVYFASASVSERGDSIDYLYAVDQQTGHKKLKVRLNNFDDLAGLVVTDTTVYYLSGGNLYSLDSTTGKEKWVFTQSEFKFSNRYITVGNSSVYFGGSNIQYKNNILYKIDRKTGKEVWKFTTQHKSLSQPIIASDKVVIVKGSTGVNENTNSTLYGLDDTTAKEIWKVEIANETTTLPDTAGGVAYFGRGKSLNAIDVTTGDIKWTFSTEGNSYDPPVLKDGAVFYNSGPLYAVDAVTGNERWRLNIETLKVCGWVKETCLVIEDNIVYTGDSKSLYGVDIVTGKQLWKFEMERGVKSTPTVSNGLVYFIGVDDLALRKVEIDALYAVDIKTGKKSWQFNEQPFDNRPVTVSNGIVYIEGDYNWIYALK